MTHPTLLAIWGESERKQLGGKWGLAAFDVWNFTESSSVWPIHPAMVFEENCT